MSFGQIVILGVRVGSAVFVALLILFVLFGITALIVETVTDKIYGMYLTRLYRKGANRRMNTRNKDPATKEE